MKRNRSDSFAIAAEEETPQEDEVHSIEKMKAFLNHDIRTEVVRFVGVFGRDSSCLALVNHEYYQALVSVFDAWSEYQGGFGLPKSMRISESGSGLTFNYRAAVVDSLKGAAEGDRSRVLMEPERYVGDGSTNRKALTLPAGQTCIALARTGHLRSKRHASLWGPMLRFFQQVRVPFLSAILPVTAGDCYPCNWLTGVEVIGLSSQVNPVNFFLSDCHSLTAVDLAGLSSVTAIGNLFLFVCRSLTSVDLAGLSSATSIGHSFLCGCSSLKNADLAGLCSVTAIGNDFLYGCRSLTSVDLAGLSSATSIGHNFLSGCSSLSSVDLAGLNSVTAIGNHFLYDCRSLTSVDLAGLSSVTSIGHHFLYGCSSLSSVKYPQRFP